MKTNLLYLNNKENIYCKPSSSTNASPEADTIRDLKLDILLDAMADGDAYIRKLCKNTLLQPLTDPEEILMRQGVVRDAIKVPNFFSTIYRLSTESMEKTAIYNDLNHPEYKHILTSIKKVIAYSEMAEIHLKNLEIIYHLITEKQPTFSSDRLLAFCTEFLSSYPKNFIEEAKSTVGRLSSLNNGTEFKLGGHIGQGLKLTDTYLHNVFEDDRNDGSATTASPMNRKRSVFHIFDRDEAIILLDNNRLEGYAKEIKEASLIWILKTLSDFTNECRSLYQSLREMSGFYSGSVRLYQRAMHTGTTLCFPEFTYESSYFELHNLTELGLALKDGKTAIGNTLTMSGKKLCIITGPNQGGKTTFLRSIGLAQLMAQSGLFVAAEYFKGSIYNNIYTHFPNEEDKEMRHGLLEEELSKLDGLVTQMQPGALLLMNESFSSTIEYDAGILAEEVTAALISCGMTICFVTHLYEFAHKHYIEKSEATSFLRAGRNSDGSRTFLIEEGEPSKSSFSMDLFKELFKFN